MAGGTKFLGREALKRRLAKLVPDIEQETATAQLEAAKTLAADIRAHAPVDTGDYRDSIEGARFADREGDALVKFKNGARDPNATGVFASYIWRFLEFGTSDFINKGRFAGSANPGIAPQPHIFPTFRASRKKIKRHVAKAINRAVRRAKG